MKGRIEIIWKRWHKALNDILKDMNFILLLPDPCIWWRKNSKHNVYEYIAVYVDDLFIASQIPSELISILKSKYQLNVEI